MERKPKKESAEKQLVDDIINTFYFLLLCFASGINTLLSPQKQSSQINVVYGKIFLEIIKCFQGSKDVEQLT